MAIFQMQQTRLPGSSVADSWNNADKAKKGKTPKSAGKPLQKPAKGAKKIDKKSIPIKTQKPIKIPKKIGTETSKTPKKAETEKPKTMPLRSKYGQLLPDFQPTAGFDVSCYLDSIPATLRTQNGQFSFCDGLQEKIDLCYKRFDIAPLHLTPAMREEIHKRIGELAPINSDMSVRAMSAFTSQKFSVLASTFFDRYGLLSAIPIIGSFFYYVFSSRASFSSPKITIPAARGVEVPTLEHELLHVAAPGGFSEAPSLNPLEIIANTLLAPFRLILDAIHGISKNDDYSIVKIPFMAPGEFMNSLIIGPRKIEYLGEGTKTEVRTVQQQYVMIVDPLTHALHGLGPGECKEILDALVLTWLDFGTREQRGKAEDFLSKLVK